MKKLIVVITLMLISVILLRADVYIKTQTHTPAMEMMGKKFPEKNMVSEQWLGNNKMAMISASQITVIDLSIKKVFFIYHDKKSYVETSLPLDMSKLLPANIKGMAAMLKMTVKVSPTGQTKTINGRKCDGYNIEMKTAMMPIKSISWVTTDVPFDWKGYAEKMYATALAAVMPFVDEASLAELRKIQGIQIAQESTMSMMGNEMKTTSEVVEMIEKPAPAGLYSVPAGYTKIDNLIMAMGMK